MTMPTNDEPKMPKKKKINWGDWGTGITMGIGCIEEDIGYNKCHDVFTTYLAARDARREEKMDGIVEFLKTVEFTERDRDYTNIDYDELADAIRDFLKEE